MNPQQQLTHALDQWVAFLDDYSLEMICRPTPAAAWSLGQVYVHIIDDTSWYVEQVVIALSGDDHYDREMTEEGRQILAHGFPEIQIAGPATNTVIPQPESLDVLKKGLLAIRDQVMGLQLNEARGKTQHPGFGYFTAAEWLRFAAVHMQHHLRQKKRIDAALFADTVHLSVQIQASAGKVWEMLTQPEKIGLWMMDTPVQVYSDWKTGSPLVFRGDLHGIPYEHKGVIVALEQEQVLAYTHWSTLSERPDEPGEYGVITFRLANNGAATILDFTQTNTGKYATRQHIKFYWTVALGLIKKHCEPVV